MKQGLYSGCKLPSPGTVRTLSFGKVCVKCLPVLSLEDGEEECHVYEQVPS